MLIDTHCHLNFKTFENNLDQVVNNAKKVGVNKIVVPGTDVETSRKAVKIAEKYPGVFAAVGIHPHHVFEIYSKSSISKFFNGKQKTVKNLVSALLKLLSHPKVVAIGEVGIDKHIYQKTKHENYKINPEFIKRQKEFFIAQIKLANKYKKALIIHNREAKKDVLELLTNHHSLITSHSSVFHCCEPDMELLEFAKEHKMFIGVDGDITYRKDKQEFIKTVPLEMLVLETDSPFLLPQLLSMRRPSTRYNEPKNIVLIAEFVAKLKNVLINQLIDTTTENAKKLFKI